LLSPKTSDVLVINVETVSRMGVRPGRTRSRVPISSSSQRYGGGIRTFLHAGSRLTLVTVLFITSRDRPHRK
jgi:hypothetical protein